MEKVVLYIVIFIGYLVYQGYKASQKNKQKTGQVTKNPNKPLPKQQQGQSRKGNSPEDLQRKIFKELGLEEYLDPKTDSKNTPTRNEGPNPFIKNEVEKARKSHFSEENLVKRVEKAHSEGKEIIHHTHQYVDEMEFKRFKEVDLDEVYRIKEKITDEEDEDGQKVKRKHPLLKALKNKKRVREAVILKEIIDKKY